MDIMAKPVKDACVDMLKRGQRQRRYTLKKKYFDGVPANQVRTTSPVSCMNDLPQSTRYKTYVLTCHNFLVSTVYVTP